MADFNLSNARILSPGVVATPLDAVPKERSFYGSVAEGLKTAKDLQDYWKQENDLKKRNKLLTDYGNLEDDGSIAELDRQIAAIEARLSELDQMQKDVVNSQDVVTPEFLAKPKEGQDYMSQFSVDYEPVNSKDTAKYIYPNSSTNDLSFKTIEELFPRKK